MFTWLSTVRALSPAALTVRAQTVSPNDRGQLRWTRFMPRVDVASIRFADIRTMDDRPVADRREWNAEGRLIPLVIPPFRNMVMTPIESRDVIDEQEMQEISAGANGNAQVVQEIVGTSMPARVDRLASANYRRLELDMMQAWTRGTITSRNPEDASKTVTASFGFDAARYTTALTPWSDPSVNAYDLLTAWIEQAVDAVGSIQGIALRLPTLKAIQADAPNLPNGVRMTRAQLADRIEQDTGSPFTFELIEDSFDVFDDGGITKTRTKVWPSHIIAAIPQGERIGDSLFAPVIRAQDIATALPNAGIDVRGNTVFYHERNGGRELRTECQINAMPVPVEQNLWVQDVGV